MSPDQRSAGVRERIRQARWELRTLAGQHPSLSRALLRQSGEFPTDETDIVIEGFPRTGNTFAVIAFQQAQPERVSIAHHTHAPASVIHATRESIPALVLIRPPEDTVLSFVLRYPHLTMTQALRSYARFYEPLLPLVGRFVLGSFDEVTSDFGEVIRRVNRLFGTEFVEFRHSHENVHNVQKVVDEWDRNTFGDDEALERGRARPVEERGRMKSEVRSVYRSAELARARDRAESVFERLAGERGNGQDGY